MPCNPKPKWSVVLLLVVLSFAGCGAINPFCGSSRPRPVLAALAPNTATTSEVQLGFVLVVTGSHFVSSSVIEWNGVALATTLVSGTQLQATITTAQAAAPGTAQVLVHTPANLSGDLGCSSGGNSQALTFTIT